MPLIDQDRERIRYALGYPSVKALAAAQFGVPRPLATNYQLETAMNQILENAVGRVRDILAQLDTIEQQMKDATGYMVADQLEELKLRADYPQLLENEYNRWAGRLADIFGVPYYGFSMRFQAGPGQSQAASGVKNIRRL